MTTGALSTLSHAHCQQISSTGWWLNRHFVLTFFITIPGRFSCKNAPDSKEGCHFTFHRLSAKAFPRKPFRKPLPQGLRRKAFYELPQRQVRKSISAQTVSETIPAKLT
ncbi:hypothetical protein AVEN_35806-1 [Araneus ventricosus]|uniref:Uncharacterized protein n=1 Tax=Araneus ventricosus TaxID=182803 RepID=A0A4Y2BJ44_ARAVE|nr:hypothetical protein AVEN_35806-1 [Araneus ventricosus]